MHRRTFLGTVASCVAATPLTAALARQAPRRAAVQIGYCTGVANLAAAKAAGFDYVELGTTAIAEMSEADFESALVEAARVGLPTPVSNVFVPGTIRLTGPVIDRDAQMAYVRKALDRMKRFGTTIIVFGSGGARRVPDGFSHDEAFAQLVDFGKRIAPEARARGITIAVEPLRREECNIINSAAEGLRLVRAINHPNFQLMVDFYHLSSEHEDPQIVLDARDHITHLHMANPQGRVFPLQWTEFDYAPFFANLRQIGYGARMSVEASTKALAEEGPKAVALLRRAFES